MGGSLVRVCQTPPFGASTPWKGAIHPIMVSLSNHELVAVRRPHREATGHIVFPHPASELAATSHREGSLCASIHNHPGPIRLDDCGALQAVWAMIPWALFD
jgi:hypothetical protein